MRQNKILRRNSGTLIGCCMLILLLILTGFSQCSFAVQNIEKETCKPADVIFNNAQFKTLTPSKPPINSMAVLNGQIIALGLGSTIEKNCKGPNTKIIDLKNATALPGFIDSYTHFTLYGWLADNALDLSTTNSFQREDWQPVKSTEEFLHLVQNNLPTEKKWYYIYGYDPSRMSGDKLTQTQLDELSNDVPIVVFYATGDYAQLNQAAIHELKSNDATQQLYIAYDGGISEKDLNLFLKEIIQGNKLYQAQKKAVQLFAQNGFTTVYEIQPIPEWSKAYEMLQKKESLPIEVKFPNSVFSKKPVKKYTAQSKKMPANPLLKIDGLSQNYEAYLEKPYLSPPKPLGENWRGALNHPPQLIDNFLSKAQKQKMHPLIDVHGNGALALLIKQLNQPGLSAKLFNLQLLTKNQLNELKNLDVQISVAPATLYFWGESLCQTRLGSDRAINLLPYQSIKNTLQLVAHLDAPSTPPSILEAINWMSTRIVQRWNYPANRKCPQYFNIEERVEPEQAIHAFTVNAAKFHGISAQKGTLEVGKDADIVLFHHEPGQVNGKKNEVIGIIKKGVYYPFYLKKKPMPESVLMKIEGLKN